MTTKTKKTAFPKQKEGVALGVLAQREPEELIDMSEPIKVEATFTLKEIKMKMDDLAWRIKFALNKRLDSTFREYDVRLSVNTDPYDDDISLIERKIEEVESESHLFGDEKVEKVRYLRGQILDIKDKLGEVVDKCETMEFKGIIEELKYKDARTTQVVMIIPAEAVETLNEQRVNMEHYKIELIRK